MASAFGHALASTVLGKAFFHKIADKKLLWLGAASAALPDVDVIAFRFGIPYEHILGHRGFTHSFGFALLWALLLCFVFYRKKMHRIAVFCFFFIATVSHPLLDMCTNGGRGCAILWPLTEERFFFPFRPIQVSSIYPSQFFSEWGLRVLASELFWIGLPCLVIASGAWCYRHFRGRSAS